MVTTGLSPLETAGLGLSRTGDYMLELVGVSKGFGGVQAVSALCFGTLPGHIAALIGPNGAGKTTVFNLISGIITPDEGKITFQGKDLKGRQAYEIAALGIARTFQNLQIFGNMSVLENVAVGRHLRSKAGLLQTAFRLPSMRREEHEIQERARYFLEWIGLGAHAERPAGTLAFGQQRLLEIARALATEPQLLLLDEPAAGLNSAETEQLAGLICRIRDSGVDVLLVEHDMDLVMGIADCVVVMDYGRKIAIGTPDEVQNDAAVIAAYLGDEWNPAPEDGEEERELLQVGGDASR